MSKYIRGTSFTEMKRAVSEGKRLTRKQNEALIDYASEQASRAMRCYDQLASALAQMDYDQEMYTVLIDQWNDLVHSLDKALHVKVFCRELDKDKRPLWSVEFSDRRATQNFLTFGELYTYAIMERMRDARQGERQEEERQEVPLSYTTIDGDTLVIGKERQERQERKDDK